MIIEIPVSVGELLDKISILTIKSQYSNNTYITKELKKLIKIANHHNVYDEKYLNKLLEVNKILWDIEDNLRLYEKKKCFDETFIHSARMVYKTNDERARIKKEVNEKYNSSIREIKLYE
jgi:hypothetical protein